MLQMLNGSGKRAVDVVEKKEAEVEAEFQVFYLHV